MAGSLREWIAEHSEQISSEPVRGLFHAAFTLYLGIWYTITSRWPIGTHVYDEDWDLLVILDACRVDVLEEVADDYEFIESVDSRWSVGSHSHEWLTQTFSNDYAGEIANTVYVSGNGHTDNTFVDGDYPPDETVPFCWPDWHTVGTDSFGRFEPLWETSHEDKLGVLPRAITDQTVSVARESDHDRMIAHYMQPHIPYISEALAEDRSPTKVESKGWKLLKTGEADHDEVWQLYKDNLRLVLEEVELLLENVDADNVVITADHGNAFGEHSIYGHPEGMLLPCVKQVPWVKTSASDKNTFKPTGGSTDMGDDKTAVEDHLADLGYM